MGNETSVPDGGATTPEELARAADALSGTSPPPAAAAAAAAAAASAGAAAADRGASSGGPDGAAAAGAPPPRTPNAYAAGGTAPLGGAEAIGGPTPPGSQQLEKAKAMQQQMKAKAAAMKAKGMTSAKSMFQRTGIGSAGGGGAGGAGSSAAALASAPASASQGEPSVVPATPATSSATHPLHHQQEHHGRIPSNLLPGQGGKGAVVDVMYATENHAHAHAHQQHGHQQQYQPQHGMPSAAAAISAEGAAMTTNSASAAAATAAAGTGGSMPASASADALRRQMQDMALSGGQGGGVAPPAATAAVASAGTYLPGGGKTTGLGPTGDEEEWQAAWEEDDESSGDEEEDYDTADEGGSRRGSVSGPSAGPSVAAASAAMLGPPFRVSMDGGHSSISPANLVATTSMHPNLAAQQQQHAAAMGSHMAAPPPAQQQQFVAPAKPALPPGQMGPGATVPPDVPFDAANAAAVAAQQQQVQQHGGGAMVGGPLLDGVVWETQALGGDSAIKPAGSTDSMDDRPSEKMFTSMRVLGKGSFGKVVLVQKRTGKERGGLFAMKILRKTHLVKRRQIERTKTERKVLALVDHPFIMKLHFAFQSEDKLYLVLDYCPGGELFFHLSRYRRFPERVARFFSAELLLALGHLHKKGIIYRDLKPENVLLDADGHVKLGDFGLAKDRISHPCQGATSMCGTPEYMAPEVLAQAGHGFCVDYWGLGMLTYEMMTGLPPWYTTDRSKLFRRLKSAPLDIPTFFSMESASCVSQLLERNPRKRLGVFGIKSAMQHEFFRGIDWRSLRDRRINSPIRPCESWKANQQNQQISNTGGTANPASISHHASASGQGQTLHLSQNDLDVATANFDQTFTRMALETIDNGGEGEREAAPDDGKAEEELNADTFVGFTFHENELGRTRTTDGVGRIRGSSHPNQQITQQQQPPPSSQKYNSHGPRR